MARAESKVRHGYKYFPLVSMFFIAVLLISNIGAQKLFAVGHLVFPGGILLFPLSYLFGDVLTEVYGYAKTRQVIWVGLACNLMMVVTLHVVIWLPPAEGWPLQTEFAKALGMLPRVTVASMIAYLAGAFSNSYVLAKMKVKTGGRHLWMRAIGSTIVGQGVDTSIFVIVSFAYILPSDVLVKTILSGYAVKVLYEVLATPLTYVVVNFLKTHEGIDAYDTDTKFNPFLIQAD